MKRYIALIFLLFVITACDSFILDDDVVETPTHVESKSDTATAFQKIAKVDFGPVTSADIDKYLDFQTKISCGEAHEKVLREYNWTIDRVVEVGKQVSNNKLSEVVFSRIPIECPERLESVEPSIKSVE